MPVWFEYERRNTFFHRMNPISKTIFILPFLAFSAIYFDLWYLVPLAIIGAVFSYAAKVPRWWWRPVFAIIFTITIVNLAFAFFQNIPGMYKSIPSEIALRSLFELTPPGTPIVGRLYLCYGGLIWLVATVIRYPIIFAYVYVYIYSTSLDDLIKVMGSKGVPGPLLFMIQLTYVTIPYMLRMITRVVQAQTLRGWKVDTKNPIKAISKALPLAYPVTRQLANLIEQFSLSAEVRGFGAGKITIHKEFKFTILDWSISILSVVVSAVLAYLLFVHNMGTI